jgi:two-component system chemotaxis response regulator CheY
MNHILIVDDSLVIRKAITKLLKQAGYPSDHIQEANDGQQALALVEENTYDLIFSDINMPNMNGIDFITKARELNVKTPIIVISSEGHDDSLLAAIKAGASGMMRKSAFLHVMEYMITSVQQQPDAHETETI